MPLYAHRFIGTTTGGQTWLFSWWANSGQGIGNVHSAAEAWINTFWNGDGSTTGYAEETVTDVSLNSVETSEVQQSNGRQLRKRVTGLTDTGRGTGVELPADVAIVLSLRTDLANRSGRGRFYLPQPASATVRAGSEIAQGTVDNIVSSASNAWANYTATGAPVVYSRMNRSFEIIERFDVSNHYDTQRGRDNLAAQSRTESAMP